MPLAKLDLLAGYAGAFGARGRVQALVVSLLASSCSTFRSMVPRAAVVLLAVGNAVLGMALGLLASAFATTEFQAVQFMPALVIPQILLCGLIVAREEMAGWLQVIASALPLTYAFDALSRVASDGPYSSWFAVDIGVTVGATLLALALAAETLPRRTP